MMQFLKYLGAFCLLTIAASLAFCSVGVYQGVQTANRYLAGADNYTCRQFVYDLEHPETDKFAPLAIAAIAYGVVPEDGKNDDRQTNLERAGLEPAVKKVLTLCRNKPDARVLNVYAASLVSSTQTVNSPAMQPMQHMGDATVNASETNNIMPSLTPGLTTNAP